MIDFSSKSLGLWAGIGTAAFLGYCIYFDRSVITTSQRDILLQNMMCQKTKKSPRLPAEVAREAQGRQPRGRGQRRSPAAGLQRPGGRAEVLPAGGRRLQQLQAVLTGVCPGPAGRGAARHRGHRQRCGAPVPGRGGVRAASQPPLRPPADSPAPGDRPVPR